MSTLVRSFRDLRVWQAAMDLVERTYSLTGGFPRHETYGLSSQMRRAAVSIPSNLAEGHSRHYRKEYLHHVSIALGSAAELETHVEIARRLHYITNDEAEAMAALLDAMGRQVHTLHDALAKKPET
jgi:four helix bundle protein